MTAIFLLTKLRRFQTVTTPCICSIRGPRNERVDSGWGLIPSLLATTRLRMQLYSTFIDRPRRHTSRHTRSLPFVPKEFFGCRRLFRPGSESARSAKRGNSLRSEPTIVRFFLFFFSFLSRSPIEIAGFDTDQMG